MTNEAQPAHPMKLPAIGRIKVSVEGTLKTNGIPVCLPDGLWQAQITDADTGQQLCFVSGIECKCLHYVITHFYLFVSQVLIVQILRL
jgi:hypothetical protein